MLFLIFVLFYFISDDFVGGLLNKQKQDKESGESLQFLSPPSKVSNGRKANDIPTSSGVNSALTSVEDDVDFSGENLAHNFFCYLCCIFRQLKIPFWVNIAV